MSRQFTRDWFIEVARGNIPGAKTVTTFGHNPNVGSGVLADVWGQGGILTRLPSAETMNIVSTDTNDDGAPVGTGARTVLITGLDASYDEIFEIITLNGTTNVLTVNSYLRVRAILVLTADATATNSNLGIITATASVAATVQCHIEVGSGLSQQIQYTVPNGKTAYLVKWELNTFKVSGGTAAIKFDAVVTPFGAATFKVVEKSMESDNTEIDVQFTTAMKILEKTDIKITALSDTANTELYSSLFFVVIDN